jgi:hypothetical protein
MSEAMICSAYTVDQFGDRILIVGEDGTAWQDRYRAQGYRRAAFPDRWLAA